MSNPTFKAPRDVNVIQNEYTGMCTRAGHIQYQIRTLEKDLVLMNDTLRDLNAEAMAAQQAAQEKAQAEAKAQADASEEKLKAEAPSEAEVSKPAKKQKLERVKE